jgi:hypothetical protein
VRRRALLSGLGALSLGGCAAPPQPAIPLPPAAPPLALDPLAGLVAAGGLDWLVSARVAELGRASSLGKPLALILPPANLDLLADHLGFDLRLADELLVAGFGPTTLYLLRVAHDPAIVERLFRERLTGEVERSAEAPNLIRTGGLLGSTHRGLATLEPGVLAFEVGKPGPLRAVVAFALGKLKKARPALDSEPLKTLTTRLGDAPLRFFFPSPAASWKGAHGLLDRATAASVAVTPSAQGLQLRALLLGAWDDPPTVALRRLSETAQDIATSPLGRLTGLDHPIERPSLGGDREAIHLEVLVDAMKVAEGLQAATSAELRDLFPTLKRLSGIEEAITPPACPGLRCAPG